MSDGVSCAGYVKCCTGKCKVFNVIQRYGEGTLMLCVGELMMISLLLLYGTLEFLVRGTLPLGIKNLV